MRLKAWGNTKDTDDGDDNMVTMTLSRPGVLKLDTIDILMQAILYCGGSQCTGSVSATHRLGCSIACEI